jgi:hypothetical protein
MATEMPQVPPDFTPVAGVVPAWINVKAICEDAKRFVGLYAISNVDAVAINNGQKVFTTSDRNGEFRKAFRRLITEVYADNARVTAGVDDPALVYDCEAHHQWLAPRQSAMRFLYEQF